MKKVTVIGAGFAGLTVSLKLAQRGFEVDLYEKSSRVGGLLGTDITDHGISERAANALIRTELSEELFEQLNLTPSLALKASSRRFLFRGIPRQWPLSILESLGFLVRFGSKLVMGKEKLRPRPLETLQTWGQRNLGKAATKYILGPAMQGIYANDISGLSATLILKSFFRKKKSRYASKRKYKGLLTGTQGMQDLVDHLEAKIQELGVRIHLNSTVAISDIKGPVVVATSAKAASYIVKDRSVTLSSILSRIQMSSIMSVTLFFDKPQATYQGFGCLIPRGQEIKSLGVLMNSYIFEDRAHTYNETWMLGGIANKDLLDLADADVLKLIAEERFRILGHREALLDYRINRWQDALPYYDLELEKVIVELKSRPSLTGLYLHGNYLYGIGLSKILERSDRLAREIENYGG